MPSERILKILEKTVRESEVLDDQSKTRIIDLLPYWPEDGLDTLLEFVNPDEFGSELNQPQAKAQNEIKKPNKKIVDDLKGFGEVVEGKEHDLPAEGKEPTKPAKVVAEVKKPITEKSPLANYDLADILERVKMRTEAGLTMNSQDARLISEIIKYKKDSVR